ncbi:MAG: NADH:flavin oxidoreductase [Proteobacteria bacterium]|nr:NADH:flavin oxidoreductase [Pseudomonadota bacterium]MBU4382856.1 NADH:flavin oxidoreductase [Pseudomonadota bacterium]MBU4606238.1 NADH:flavin oxidoreductase [Pseudomonadota bacterium]MCG2765371.1 NADH:flavin oxidoreductase [Desulfarculaceae bacterium]
MGALFTPLSIKGLTLANRLMRSATFEQAALKDGEVSPRELALYHDLAAGGVGLVVTGIINVCEQGRISPKQNSLSQDSHIPGMARLAREVHDQGGKVAVQLFHAGREAARMHAWRGGGPAVGPSASPGDNIFAHENRAMTQEEILQVVEEFGRAAARAREAGFDGVQVHAAHAYLLSQFLSPRTNRRQDEWGGSPDNRLRLHLEVLAAIRSQVGPDYPVMFKLGVADGLEEGLPLEEGLRAAELLAQAGCDCLEISQGLRGHDYQQSEFRTKVDKPGGEAYFRAWAAEVKRRVDIPVAAVGGVRTPETAEDILAQGEADLVALSRPLISEPGLPARWRGGDTGRARCVSCNKCFEQIMLGRSISCILDREKAER